MHRPLTKDWRMQCVLSVRVSNCLVTYRRRRLNHRAFVVKPHLTVMKVLAERVTFKRLPALHRCTHTLPCDRIINRASAGVLANLDKLVPGMFICHSLSPFYICGQTYCKEHLPNEGTWLFNNYFYIKVRQTRKKWGYQ